MSRKKYLEEYRIKGEVTITEFLIEGENKIVRTHQTWFHAQGGGQKADRGHIGPAQVLHVSHNGDNIDHFVDRVEGLEVGQAYVFEIDAEWRRLNSVYHTSGHLIASLVESLNPKFIAIAGHQWPGEARVEFLAESDSFLGPDFKFQLQHKIDEAIASSLKIRLEGDPFTSRAIGIGEFAPIPCGGTHLQSLAEVQTVQVKDMKIKKGKLRVSYEAVPK